MSGSHMYNLVCCKTGKVIEFNLTSHEARKRFKRGRFRLERT